MGARDASSPAHKSGTVTAPQYNVFTQPSAGSTFAAFWVGNLFGNSVLLLGLLYAVASHFEITWLFWAALVAYYAVALTSSAHKTGTDRWPWFCNGVLWRTALEYFEMQIRCDAGTRFEPGKPYIFGMHPHAIHGFGMCVFVHDSPSNQFFARFPALRGQMYGAVASVLFYLPVVREFFLWSGFIDAGRKSLERVLKAGGSVHLLVGGEAESLMSAEGTDKVVAAGGGRKGVIRLALASGAQLVPVYAFHATDTYHTSTFLWGARMWLARNAQICLPVFWGRWFTPCPVNVRITLGIGAPIPLPAGVSVSSAEAAAAAAADPAIVDAYHAAYLRGLMDVYSRYKGEAGYPHERKLEIWAREHVRDSLFWREGEPMPAMPPTPSKPQKQH